MDIREIAALVGAESQVDSPRVLVRMSGFADADPSAVVFAEDENSLAAALASNAGLILTAAPHEDPRVMRVMQPKHAFAKLAQALRGRERETTVHVRASVDSSARLGNRVRVDALAVIEAGVTVGDDCVIGAGAVLREGVVLGDRVVVQAGAVLGSLGFGYVRDRDSGAYTLFPQQGTLVIEDDVEIGANTTIDRGALGETRVGQGTKIDNLVHIGHNCRIGRDVVIAAQVGISGSCVIEDGAVLAGQVGISDHCRVGAGVVLGGQAGVFRGKAVEGFPGEAFAGTPAEPIREYLKGLAKVRRLK